MFATQTQGQKCSLIHFSTLEKCALLNHVNNKMQPPLFLLGFGFVFFNDKSISPSHSVCLFFAVADLDFKARVYKPLTHFTKHNQQ